MIGTELKIRSFQIVSAPNLKPYVIICLNDNSSYRQELSTPVLLNTLDDITKALRTSVESTQ